MIFENTPVVHNMEIDTFDSIVLQVTLKSVKDWRLERQSAISIGLVSPNHIFWKGP